MPTVVSYASCTALHSGYLLITPNLHIFPFCSSQNEPLPGTGFWHSTSTTSERSRVWAEGELRTSWRVQSRLDRAQQAHGAASSYRTSTCFGGHRSKVYIEADLIMKESGRETDSEGRPITSPMLILSTSTFFIENVDRVTCRYWIFLCNLSNHMSFVLISKHRDLERP